jgi:hypothetical protein
MTIGLHAKALPGRIRQVPVVMQARARFPVPYLNRPYETKITDLEISGGLRPSVWETSLLGHNTFGVSLMGGYRSITMDTTLGRDSIAPNDPLPSIELFPERVEIKARWEGPFVEFGLIF